MIPTLTIAQRIVAVATAGSIGIVLWLQVSEYGLEDTPWLIGFLVIAALLFLGLKGQNNSEIASDQKQIGPSPAVPGSKHITVEQTFCSARNHFERFYREQSEAANNAKHRSKIKLHQAVLIRQAAFMAALLSLEIKQNGFANTDGADELREIAFLGISEVAQFQEEIFRQSLHPSLHGRSAKEVSDELAADMMGRAKAAVDSAKVLFFRDESFPIDPILQLLNGLVPVAKDTPDDRDRVYGPVFRSFFKALKGRQITGTEANIPRRHTHTDPTRADIPVELRATVNGLLNQMIDSAHSGEQPESMLIPSIRIKLDIIIAAYGRDMKRSISQIYDQKLHRDEAAMRASEIRTDVEKMIFNLRREPSQRIGRLFEKMLKDRPDISDIEEEVRAANALYNGVPPLS